jgi:hypothetical protein
MHFRKLGCPPESAPLTDDHIKLFNVQTNKTTGCGGCYGKKKHHVLCARLRAELGTPVKGTGPKKHTAGPVMKTQPTLWSALRGGSQQQQAECRQPPPPPAQPAPLSNQPAQPPADQPAVAHPNPKSALEQALEMAGAHLPVAAANLPSPASAGQSMIYVIVNHGANSTSMLQGANSGASLANCTQNNNPCNSHETSGGAAGTSPVETSTAARGGCLAAACGNDSGGTSTAGVGTSPAAGGTS